MENNSRYLECCGAGERAGLYFTCINSYLKAGELAYILNNSESRVLIFSEQGRALAEEALRECPNVEVSLVVDGPGNGTTILNLDEATAGFPATPIADESLGTAMLYSSGTTGRPKASSGRCQRAAASGGAAAVHFLNSYGTIAWADLSVAGAAYHSAPQAAVNLVIRNGGTAIIMERFDPEHYSNCREIPPTHSQLVPTMFSRMLKLPAEVRGRYDTSSLEVAIHAPRPVRRRSRNR